MEGIIRISIFVIVGVLLGLQFKTDKPQFGMLIGLGLALLVFGFGLDRISGVLTGLLELKDYLGAGAEYLGILVKVLMITYICEFTAGICRDAGYSVVASQVEILGKLSVMLAGISILLAVIGQIKSLL